MKSTPHFSRTKCALPSTLRRGIAGLAACALLGACSTTISLNPPELMQTPLNSLVQVGDTVTCALRDGTRAAFKVTAIESATLVGKKQRVAVADILRIDIKRFSAEKTIILTATIVGAGLIMLASHWPNPHLISYGP